MRAVAQRVAEARVDVAGETVGAITRGLLVYLAAGKNDDLAAARWMARKLATLRIFPDDSARMSLDVAQAGGKVLLVSQFTLYGDVRKGRRPSFDDASPPEGARALYEAVQHELSLAGIVVETGRFRATMAIHAVVDGPVTILIDSERRF
jgi:D-tyrosyl-tRNA(Tyr) deacylase